VGRPRFRSAPKVDDASLRRGKMKSIMALAHRAKSSALIDRSWGVGGERGASLPVFPYVPINQLLSIAPAMANASSQRTGKLPVRSHHDPRLGSRISMTIRLPRPGGGSLFRARRGANPPRCRTSPTSSPAFR